MVRSAEGGALVALEDAASAISILLRREPVAQRTGSVRSLVTPRTYRSRLQPGRPSRTLVKKVKVEEEQTHSTDTTRGSYKRRHLHSCADVLLFSSGSSKTRRTLGLRARNPHTLSLDSSPLALGCEGALVRRFPAALCWSYEDSLSALSLSRESLPTSEGTEKTDVEPDAIAAFTRDAPVATG